MSGISQYLLSIVGVVVLSMLLDLILNDGKLSKYVKSVMGLVLVFVIVYPLPKLVKNKIDFKSFIDDSMSFHEEYQSTVHKQQKDALARSLEKELEKNGFFGVQIEIWCDELTDISKISYIFVDLTNLVLSENNQHINKYEAIKILLMEQTGVEEGQVIMSV